MWGVMSLGDFPISPPFARLSRAIRAAIALILASLACQPALAAPNDTGASSGTAEIAVVSPLTLIKMKDLDFGKIAPTPTAGTVVIDPNTSVCTTTGGLLHIGGCQAAQFGGMGAKNMFVRLNAPAAITIAGPGGATMTIDTITLDTSPDLQLQANGNGNGNGNGGGGNKRYKIVTSSGIFSFNLGGTLHVAANQASGAYTGTFSITAVYQ